MTLLLRLALTWIGFLLLWLVFVFQVSPAEVIIGAIASGITVVSGYVAFWAVPLCFEPRLRWLAQVWRLPVPIATDLWLLLKHLVREVAHKPSRSSFEVTSFRVEGENCYAAAQCALAILFVSTTPNSVVLEIDRQKTAMFFHRMEPAPEPEFLRKLEN